MTTTIEEIEQNLVVDVDVSAIPFDAMSSKYLADALRDNTSVMRINLAMVNLNDDGFKLIADALIAREVSLVELNLDFTELTAVSMPIIESLIEKEKVKNIMLFNTANISDQETMKHLAGLALKHDVKVYFNHPMQRRYPDFFSEVRAKNNISDPADKFRNNF